MHRAFGAIDDLSTRFHPLRPVGPQPGVMQSRWRAAVASPWPRVRPLRHLHRNPISAPCRGIEGCVVVSATQAAEHPSANQRQRPWACLLDSNGHWYCWVRACAACASVDHGRSRRRQDAVIRMLCGLSRGVDLRAGAVDRCRPV